MTVMKVLGYSDSHLSTFFSASTRSCQASLPTASSDGPEDEIEPSEVGRTNRSRTSKHVLRFIRVQKRTFDDGILLNVPDTFELGPYKKGSNWIEELSERDIRYGRVT